MAKTTDSRPVVGTLHCAACGTVASLYQAKRGRVKGLLYKRCGCGCDQRTGAAIQAQWRREMTPRPGYEDLAEPNEASNCAVSEPIEEPKPEPKPEPKREPNKKPKALFALLALGVGMLALTGVRV